MALSTEQLSNLEYQTAVDDHRNAHQLLMQAKTAKMEALRMAKDLVMENHRKAPADSAPLTATDITQTAAEIEAFLTT